MSRPIEGDYATLQDGKDPRNSRGRIICASAVSHLPRSPVGTNADRIAESAAIRAASIQELPPPADADPPKQVG